MKPGQLTRRTPIKRGTSQLKRTKPLRFFSPKRDAERPERRRVVEAVFARDHHQCQVAWRISGQEHGITYVLIGGERIALAHCPWDCVREIHPHEIIPRSAWAAGDLVIDNVITVCARHHRWIDDYPDEAHLIGMHGYSWERPKAG